MATYRKRALEIKATQFHVSGNPELYPEGIEWGGDLPNGSGCYIVQTLEGPLRVSDGDWIITGVKGERYPCKPDVFALTYELVEDSITQACPLCGFEYEAAAGTPVPEHDAPGTIDGIPCDGANGKGSELPVCCVPACRKPAAWSVWPANAFNGRPDYCEPQVCDDHLIVGMSWLPADAPPDSWHVYPINARPPRRAVVDDIRPTGTVQVKCSLGCGWEFWVDALDKRLPDGPFICSECAGKGVRLKHAPRELVFRLFELSYVERMQIFIELKLTEPSDEGLSDSDLMKLVMQRARDRGQIEHLEAAIPRS